MKHICCIFIIYTIFPCIFSFQYDATPKGTLRIIGGKYANKGQFPYHISVLVNQIFRCGGSAISKKFVLTAAHCFFDKNIEFDSYNTEIIIGHTSIYDPRSLRNVAQVEKISIPEEFFRTDHWYINGDIAVLKLNQMLNIPLNAVVNLPKKNSYAERIGIVTGTGANNKIPETMNDPLAGELVLDGLLRYDEVRILNNIDCSEDWGKKVIPYNLVCVKAGLLRPTALCDGDSGGSLVVDGMVVGVLSIGSADCDSNVPEIFTRVSEYLGFIHKAVHEISASNIVTYILIESNTTRSYWGSKYYKKSN